MNHHPKIAHPTLHQWWNSAVRITSSDLMLPLFVSENINANEEISSMPGIKRLGISHLVTYVSPMVELGLSSVLLFGVLDSAELKDNFGTPADNPNGPVIKAVRLLRETFPNLLISCDVCLCEYTSHGHCGILDEHGNIKLKETLNRIADISMEYAKSGAHVIAPSDMMDNRIKSIKERLNQEHPYNNVTIMSYSSKFSSSMYGPFRDACKSGPQFGDRKRYQLPLGSSELGILTTERDIKEGADIVMVKPGMFYLDVIRSIKSKFPEYLMAAYQVSGEYVMIHDYASKTGNIKKIVSESLFSLKRAGANIIISYFTPLVLEWLKEDGGVLAP